MGFSINSLRKALTTGKWASQIGDKIPQEIVAFIVHWLILIAVVVLVGGGAVLLLFSVQTGYIRITKVIMPTRQA